VLFIAILVVLLVFIVLVLKIVADALAGPGPLATPAGADPVALSSSAPADPGSLSEEGNARAEPEAAEPHAPSSESDPELVRARAYNRRLEKIVHREVSRAERYERLVARTRQAARRALGTSPIGNHPLESAFLCIHGFEGSWRDRGDPYWGGLQMDWDFMRAYGREFLSHWGPASNWPRSVQITVAIKGWLSRGFGPWPQTRRFCGL
jgi:hypothetical protein